MQITEICEEDLYFFVTQVLFINALCSRDMASEILISISYMASDIYTCFLIRIVTSKTACHLFSMKPLHQTMLSALARLMSCSLSAPNHYLNRCCKLLSHDDVIKWKHFPRYWPFVRGIHRSPVNFPHKGQWRGALMSSLICAWINGWVNNREAGDLRRHLGHCDVTVMNRACHPVVITKTTFWIDVKWPQLKI